MVTESTGAAWVNGVACEPGEATISLFDAGFIGGVAIFDSLACWQGKIFKLQQHLDRFARSAHAANIELRVSGAALRELVIETTRRSGCHDAYIQLIATPGQRTTPSMPSTGDSTLIVYSIPYVWLAPREKLETGISVIFPSVRNLDPTTVDPKVKNFNRMHSYYARIEADLANADDVIMLDDRGCLTESRGANLFLVRGDKLYSPMGGILEGITRQTVFEAAESLGIPATDADLTPFDLYVADEAFLSSTAGGIIPIVQAAGRTVGAGSPGEVTRRISEVYWDWHRSGSDTTDVFGVDAQAEEV